MISRSPADFMREALRLAARGKGKVDPNPMVGAVVVAGGKVVGRGWHRKFGGPHAEVYALRAAGRRARGATLYVTLEPCSNQGKTPPCTDAIIRSGVSEVVAGMKDPNPEMNGRGLALLRGAGIRVRSGVLEPACARLIGPYTRRMRAGLPSVTIKIAQSIDGSIADRRGESRWITGEMSRRNVHERRAAAGAVLIGAGTVAKDDPLLSSRGANGRPRKRQPLRVVLSGNFSVPATAKMFRSARKHPVVVFTTDMAAGRLRRKAAALERRGVRVIGLPGNSRVNLRAALRRLATMGVTSVIAEGGPGVWAQLLKEQLAEKLLVYVSPSIIGGINAAQGIGSLPLRRRIRIERPVVGRAGEDVVISGVIVRQRPSGPDLP